ncbi:MAG: hypothetical protein UT94_C0024G0022 [Candidatus Uhrbacteria bacterium GW2011_GWF2_40_263]|nr:MAG: hypothetical protein UT94_C0024G0022 [Candidatus Uhrbacteria bacterium GW2011_GWF2_40_263]
MRRYTITIDAQFGNESQEEKGIGMLKIMLNAWAIHTHNAHKGNMVKYSMKDKGLKKELRVKDEKGYHTL